MVENQAHLFSFSHPHRMFTFLLENFDYAPRRVTGLLALVCAGMLAFGMYLQHVVGLEPCPMCIVQRYADFLVLFFAILVAATNKRALQLGATAMLLLSACSGAFVAARQSFLQWYPPEVVSCGRDFYGMIENFPINRSLPMIFKGSGDCSKIDWTFMGGSIANWSFVWFSFAAVVALTLLVRQAKR
jgi:disulfide bond formation protein DsbB